MSKKTDSNSAVMEQKVTKELRFKLTADESKLMANTAAKLTGERNATKTELDLVGRNMRKKIKDLQKEIDRLLANHAAGTEAREVEVTEFLDWEKKTVQTFYKDELHHEREMHDSELQMKLNTSAKVVASGKKPKKQTRAQKNPDKHLTPEEQRSKEIAEVHSLETRRSSKKSAVDPQETVSLN